MNHFTSLFVTTTLYRVRQRSTALRGFPAESDVCALSPPPPLEDCYRWRNHAGREGEIVVVAAGINRFRRSAVSICPSRLLLLGRFAPKWFVSGDCRLCGYGARPKADWIDPRVCAADAARRGCRREARRVLRRRIFRCRRLIAMPSFVSWSSERKGAGLCNLFGFLGALGGRFCFGSFKGYSGTLLVPVWFGCAV